MSGLGFRASRLSFVVLFSERCPFLQGAAEPACRILGVGFSPGLKPLSCPRSYQALEKAACFALVALIQMDVWLPWMYASVHIYKLSRLRVQPGCINKVLNL